jgi:hypothetical protein
MKKSKPTSKPHLHLNMRMAGKGTLIGGSVQRPMKGRCSSSERLKGYLREETIKDDTRNTGMVIEEATKRVVTLRDEPASS